MPIYKKDKEHLMNYINQFYRLKKRPHGLIEDGDFDLGEGGVAPLKDGEVLVKTEYISIDPSNRLWMSDKDQYLPPVKIGEV